MSNGVCAGEKRNHWSAVLSFDSSPTPLLRSTSCNSLLKDETEFWSLAGLQAACNEESQASRPNAVLKTTLAAGGLGFIECSDRNCSFGSPIQRTSDLADDRWRLIGSFHRWHTCRNTALQVQQAQPALEQEAAIPDEYVARVGAAAVKAEEEPDDRECTSPTKTTVRELLLSCPQLLSLEQLPQNGQ